MDVKFGEIEIFGWMSHHIRTHVVLLVLCVYMNNSNEQVMINHHMLVMIIQDMEMMIIHDVEVMNIHDMEVSK